MSHLTRSSTRSAARRGRPVRLLLILIAATLAAGCLAYVAITTMVTGPRAPGALTALAARTGQATNATPAKAAAGAAAAASTAASTATPVPPAPAGWATVFKDGFAGPAGSAPAQANWFYDIGTGYGTGEVEHTTSSTSNVYLDGHGHLVLKATRANGSWTSARIESARDDFQAPPGGELEMTASIEQPDPADGLGYWPAFWALGSPMRTGGSWPTSGELDLMEDVNGLNQASQTLHDAAGSDGHPLVACRGARCESGYHTYSVIVSRANTNAEYLQFLMDGRVTDTITEAQVGGAAWHEAIDHGFFIIFDLAMGGNYPDGKCNCTTPTAATSSGASMSVGYVAVYEKGGNSTPSARPASTGRVTGIDGRCLANQNGLNTEGNPIDASACNGSSGQRWSAYSDHTLRAEGGCLDIAGGATASGTDVDWYPCNGTAAQAWTREANGELVNPKSGLCLTDPAGSKTARLDIATCADAAAQRWSNPTATTTTTTTATPTTTATNTTTTATTASAAGPPPASFWGSTSTIPTAKHVLEVKIINQTNGRYPNSQVYWSFNGTEKSIAQQQYIDMPANSSGRMYFYLGSPNGKYFDFIEFTVGTASMNVDTTRVDRFGLKLALLAHSHSGQTEEVGENYATFKESRAATFARFEAFVPTQFKGLATIDAPYGIPSPGNDPAFQPGGRYATYFTAYATAHGAKADTTADVFGCGGTLSANPPLCAALNRHVAQLPASAQSNPAEFYRAGPANYYAEFWHENAINGKQYGFPYDDDASQSSDISVANPQYMIVAVGW
jgi:Ricin-type beta-trefoil lectin domain/Beta-1,3-glucanase/Glycosyl hydrolases family 16